MSCHICYNDFNDIVIGSLEKRSEIDIFGKCLENLEDLDKKMLHNERDRCVIYPLGNGIKKKIKIGEGGTLKYLFLCIDGAELELEVETNGDEADIAIHGIFLARSHSTIHTQVQVDLKHNKSKAKVHLVSFLQDESSCHIDGNICIAPGTQGCDGSLLEENIILGKKISLHTLPMLDVQTNDVVASHGAKIEKLDPEKLFYMQSKSISLKEAKKLLVSGYFETLFSLVTHDPCNYCEEKQCLVKDEMQAIRAVQDKYLEYLNI